MILRCGLSLTLIMVSSYAVETQAQEPAASAPHPTTMPSVRDNLAIKAEWTDAGATGGAEKTLRVYVRSTLAANLSGLKLEMLSDPFEAIVTPAPTWKTYPDLSGGNNSKSEYFTVAFKRKPGKTGVADEVFLKLQSAQADGLHTLAFMPLAEAMDLHEIPFCSNFALNGQASPQKWTRSLALTGFRGYKKEGDTWSSRTRGLTRLHLTADDNNLYLLVVFMGVGKSGTLKLSVAPEIEAKPAWVAIDRSTGNLTASAAVDGMESKKCTDDPLLTLDPKDPFKSPPCDIYECRIPRKSLGISDQDSFLANVESNVTFWRGNPQTGSDPMVFGRLIIKK